MKNILTMIEEEVLRYTYTHFNMPIKVSIPVVDFADLLTELHSPGRKGLLWSKKGPEIYMLQLPYGSVTIIPHAGPESFKVVETEH